MPKYQFFYPGDGSVDCSDPDCSDEETLKECLKSAKDFVKYGSAAEVVVMELGRNMEAKRIVAKVTRAGETMVYPTEVTVY